MTEKAEQPAFFVGNVPVFGDTILAPMAGYADIPFRTLCRGFGSAMSYSEFVAAEMLIQSRPNRYWDLLRFAPSETPKVFQIFGHNPDRLLAAARRVASWGPDLIDINMGCATRRVSGRGAGVGLMRHPKKVARIFELLTRHLDIPVTAKIRLGWDEDVNFLNIGRVLQESGAAMIAIHGRTKQQKYGGKADWDAVAALKQAVTIPVIGNGDIRTPSDIDRMLTYTGCDGVMIGRASVGNPWLFDRRDSADLHWAEILPTVLNHLDAMVQFYGERWGLLQFRKHAKAYLRRLRPAPPDMRRLLTATSRRSFFSSLVTLFNTKTMLASGIHGLRPEDASLLLRALRSGVAKPARTHHFHRTADFGQ